MENLPAIVTELAPFLTYAKDCQALEVKDLTTYTAVSARRLELKTGLKLIDSRRKELTRPLDDKKKEIMAFFEKPKIALETAEKIIAAKMVAYDQEQQRKRDIEQAEINKMLAEKAEAERKALEEKAVKAVQRGKDELALALVEKAEAVKPEEIILAPAKPITAGVSYRTYYDVEVIDFAALPDKYKLVNESALRKAAIEFKGISTIPGVKFIERKQLIQR